MPLLPQDRPSSVTALLRTLAFAILYGCGGGLLGGIIGYGIMRVSHNPNPVGMENLVSDFCPAAGAMLGLYTGIFSALLARSRLGWLSRIFHGGMWLCSLLTLAYLALALAAEKSVELQELLLCWLLGFIPGCLAGALSILFREVQDRGTGRGPS